MARPSLTPTTSAADFLAFYWLKRELMTFCQAHGISAAGSKQELSDRIAAFLATGSIPTLPKRNAQRTAAPPMPTTFSRQTIIGMGWRCGEPLRAFFVQEIGPRFHFNGVMRHFIKAGAGKTLADAIDAWHRARQQPQPNEIAPQFEYNRHMRAFFQANPGKTRQAAIAAWNAQKAQRKPSAAIDP